MKIHFILFISFFCNSLIIAKDSLQIIDLGHPELRKAGLSSEQEAELAMAESNLISANDLWTVQDIKQAVANLDASANDYFIQISNGFVPISSEAEFQTIGTSFAEARKRLREKKTVSESVKTKAIIEAKLNVTNARFKLLKDSNLKSKLNLEAHHGIEKDQSKIYIMDSEGRIFVWSPEGLRPTLVRPGSSDWRFGITLLTDGDLNLNNPHVKAEVSTN